MKIDDLIKLLTKAKEEGIIEVKIITKIAKTSGAYQDLLKLIYKTIGWCVLSILVVIFSKIIDVNYFKIIALSICFGGLTAVLYATFLFKKLMNLAFLHN